MSGIKGDVPKKSVGNFIEELKRKQESKAAPVPQAVAAPHVKKVSVVPPLQGAPLLKQPVKRPLPVLSKKQPVPPPVGPKKAVPVLKQKQPLPVPQKADEKSYQENIEAGHNFYLDGDLIKSAYHYKLALDEG